MLRHTFVHLPGFGPRRERALWDRGILDWECYLSSCQGESPRGKGLSSALPLVRGSIDALSGRDPGFFGPLLPSRETWRLFSEFADLAVFLDIETTGLSGASDDVTVIGAFGGGELALFVKGINLDEFPAFIERFPLIVSYNGSQFDVPFLRAHFPAARLDQAHIDLRFVLASLGYKGGLKAVEGRLGLGRDASIQGVDGFEAVRLWHRHRRGDRGALEKLVLYNVTDVANLVPLAEVAAELKCRSLEFPGPAAAIRTCGAPRLDHLDLAEWTARRLASF